MSYTLIYPFANLAHLPLPLLQEEGGEKEKILYMGEAL
jgi:hypothetical protein